MSSHTLHTSLLRISVLYILRAAGFQSTRREVVDTVVELAGRYLTALANAAAVAHHTAAESRTELQAQVTDVRVAMEECGVFRPQLHATEEAWRGAEDLRGLESFVLWFNSQDNREIQRIAGVAPGAAKDGAGIAEGQDDFLTVLKRKRGASDDEQRYQGTALGPSQIERPIRIVGGPVDNLNAWAQHVAHIKHPAQNPAKRRHISSARIMGPCKQCSKQQNSGADSTT